VSAWDRVGIVLLLSRLSSQTAKARLLLWRSVCRYADLECGLVLRVLPTVLLRLSPLVLIISQPLLFGQKGPETATQPTALPYRLKQCRARSQGETASSGLVEPAVKVVGPLSSPASATTEA